MYIGNLVFSVLVSLTSKNPKNCWYIWQYICGWRLFHQLERLRLVLGSVYLERFKSSMIFYKVSICPIALDFSCLYYSKNVKVYRMILFRINSYFSQIYILSVAPKFVQCFGHFNYNTFTFLFSKVTSLQYFVFCIRKVRYLSPTLLLASALQLWRKRTSRSPHSPPKICVYIV